MCITEKIIMNCDLCNEQIDLLTNMPITSLYLVILDKKEDQCYVCKNCLGRLLEIKEQLTKYGKEGAECV